MNRLLGAGLPTLRILAVIVTAALVTPAVAVQPDEVLQDPALEQRARDISEGLRCLVCQNESIDESDASLARDLRLLVRERLTEGDSDDEVVSYIVDRYGEFVLLNPTTDGWNRVLWASGPALFLLALGIGAWFIRSRSVAPATAEAALSDDERKRLQALLKD